MKKITHIGMAALVAMGMLGTSCNKAESPEIETPETQKENIVTLTTTVGFAADGTKALTSGGVKTFAVGETMAIYYWKNKGNDHEKAVSAPLTAGDITNGGKSATFTFTLDNPYKDQSVVYIYPAAMANANFTPNYDALYNNQDGTLATLASNFDFCTRSGAWSGGNLPSLTLVNQLAILAITLKDNATPTANDITSTITGMTVSDGTYTYNVSRSAAAGPIYVAIRPTSDATITVTATDGTKNYTKTLTGKTYAANNGYSLSWRMAVVVPSFTINGSGTKVLFAPGNLQAKNTTANSTTGWTWSFAAHQYDYIGSATANNAVGNNLVTTAGTVDLFGWVGNTSSLAAYGINNNDTDSNYGNNTSNTLKSDWGVAANAASLGGHNDWRTLSSAEWEWLLGPSSSPNPGTNCRTSSTVNGTANARYAKATVASKAGIILFPDTYTHPSDVTAPASINTANAAFTVNSYDATAWGKMETAGAVFLPAAGNRNGTNMEGVGTYGGYWSSTPCPLLADNALNVYFPLNNVNPASTGYRSKGRSVRLVRQVE